MAKGSFIVALMFALAFCCFPLGLWLTIDSTNKLENAPPYREECDQSICNYCNVASPQFNSTECAKYCKLVHTRKHGDHYSPLCANEANMYKGFQILGYCMVAIGSTGVTGVLLTIVSCVMKAKDEKKPLLQSDQAVQLV
jgi:hypothetical protein